MLSPLEQKILQKIAEVHLIRKDELKRMLAVNGNPTMSAIELVLSRLVQKDILSTVTTIGPSCYVITQKGTRLLGEL